MKYPAVPPNTNCRVDGTTTFFLVVAISLNAQIYVLGWSNQMCVCHKVMCCSNLAIARMEQRMNEMVNKILQPAATGMLHSCDRLHPRRLCSSWL